jgi:hypothetical protein
MPTLISRNLRHNLFAESSPFTHFQEQEQAHSPQDHHLAHPIVRLLLQIHGPQGYQMARALSQPLCPPIHHLAHLIMCLPIWLSYLCGALSPPRVLAFCIYATATATGAPTAVFVCACVCVCVRVLYSTWNVRRLLAFSHTCTPPSSKSLPLSASPSFSPSQPTSAQTHSQLDKGERGSCAATSWNLHTLDAWFSSRCPVPLHASLLHAS